MTDASILLAGAHRQFETPPPDVTAAEAERLARDLYCLSGRVRLLSGERDRNFLVKTGDAGNWVLKFINDAEPEVETAMQVAALAHMAGHRLDVAVPSGLETRWGDDVFKLILDGGRSVRGRCYSFVEGDLAANCAASDPLRRSVGRTAARIAQSLSGFRHEGASRLSLWDLTRVGDLAGLTAGLAPSPVNALIGEFLGHFDARVRPWLGGLRRQVVHNDLSRSNMVMEADRPDRISGVLDFGDMIEAPLLCELAVAASYQLAGSDPLAALREVARGFSEVTPLDDLECRLLLDFVLARLVGRILISEWRAARFPENGAYILRSNKEARGLLEALAPAWRTAGDRDWRTFFSSEGIQEG